MDCVIRFKVEYHISIEPNSWILVELIGEITAQERNSMIYDLKRVCDDHGISKVLVDLNKARANTSYVDDFNFGTFLTKHMSGISIASISQTMGRVNFVTDVVTVRGHTTRIFPNREEGLRWLGIPA